MIAASIRNTNLFDKEEVPVLRGGLFAAWRLSCLPRSITGPPRRILFFIHAKEGNPTLACLRKAGYFPNLECPTPIEEGRLGKIRAKHYSLLDLKSKKLKLE